MATQRAWQTELRMVLLMGWWWVRQMEMQTACLKAVLMACWSARRTATRRVPQTGRQMATQTAWQMELLMGWWRVSQMEMQEGMGGAVVQKGMGMAVVQEAEVEMAAQAETKAGREGTVVTPRRAP